MSMRPASSSTRLIGLAARQAVEPSLQPEELGTGLLGVERDVLERDADAQPHPFGLGGDVVPGDDRPPATRREQRAQHPDRRRLSGRVRPEEAVDLAAPDLEVEAVDRDQLAEAANEPVDGDRDLR